MPKVNKSHLITLSSKIDKIITVAKSYDDAFLKIKNLKVCGKSIKEEKIIQILSNRHSIRINSNLKK